MNRRGLLQRAGALPLLALLNPFRAALVRPAAVVPRVRPSDRAWPSPAQWGTLNRDVGGRLISVQSPFAACASAPNGAACRDAIQELHNPYFLGDQPGATQTSGWLDAWTSTPSTYAVAASDTADVAAAVNFAREHHLRLVIKGGGHSYQGTSNAADSLLIWTRAMNRIVLHDAFVAQGCAGVATPQPAVTVGAGALWMHVYEAVTTQAGRYVQGGGCATVGVAGLIHSGGFGSFSKNYGLAAAGLLEAEIVTADGAARIANACTNPDLFWGIKGGGGGSLGVITALTLKTHDLPSDFGVAFMTIRAASDTAFRRLIGEFIRVYRDRLFNPHWGESVALRANNTLAISMVSQGLSAPQSQDAWRPFLDWVAASPQEFTLASAPVIASIPAQHWWDADYLRAHAPGAVKTDDRPGVPNRNVWWAGDQGQVGWFLHGFDSAWLPASLLDPPQRERLADALFAATRYWSVELHFNKGLAGAPPEAVAAARDAATNPAVLTAFAIAIIAGAGPPAFPDLPGRAPDLAAGRRDALAIREAMGQLREVVPDTGSYVSESNFFARDWQRAFWGANYPRLQAVKATYDPAGLFFVHHGVGSEHWSADGFTPVAGRSSRPTIRGSRTVDQLHGDG
ncbi:MAG TPA: FAD-binding oxidoreductase [bacterium]|nr:FAD-binding oxidoreductase [bacterium]